MIVHLAVPHPTTGMFGQFNTPLEHVATACMPVLTEKVRRTLKPEMVTCSACLLIMMSKEKP